MADSTAQPGILAPVPQLSRYLRFRLKGDGDARLALARLRVVIEGMEAVVGLGASLVAHLGATLEGLHAEPAYEGASEPVPNTPAALWVWLRAADGDDRGTLLHRGRRIALAIADTFELDAAVDGFRHGTGQDLTGYEDGTENPKAEDATEAALVTGVGPGQDGASLVAVQVWRHDLSRFEGFSRSEQDHIVGRNRESNEELEDAPASAHVKRTAQESFEPAAFMLRRSMPFVEGEHSGLMFVAFGRSFYAFEAQLRRMLGLEDRITDGLFRFSRIVGTSYYWCPPTAAGRLDLRALGIA